jgi:hypothetical protein
MAGKLRRVIIAAVGIDEHARLKITGAVGRKP